MATSTAAALGGRRAHELGFRGAEVPARGAAGAAALALARDAGWAGWQRIEAGRYAGKSLPEVLLDDPDHVLDLAEQGGDDPLAEDARALWRQIAHLKVPREDGEEPAVVEYQLHDDGSYAGVSILPRSQATAPGRPAPAARTEGTFDLTVLRRIAPGAEALGLVRAFVHHCLGERTTWRAFLQAPGNVEPCDGPGRCACGCPEATSTARRGGARARTVEAPPPRAPVVRGGARMADEAKLREGDVSLRPWLPSDAEALVRLGDDRDIWLNLRDRFPHPLTLPAAQFWLADRAAERGPATTFAILVKGEVAGGVRLKQREDAHHVCADLTFWLGRPFWGRGIALGAVRAATRHAFETLGLVRLQAFVFDWNPAAARVLEEAGFELEGRLRRYVMKDGRLGDALLYARLRGDPAP